MVFLSSCLLLEPGFRAGDPRAALGARGGPAPWTGRGHRVPRAAFKVRPCALEFQR